MIRVLSIVLVLLVAGGCGRSTPEATSRGVHVRAHDPAQPDKNHAPPTLPDSIRTRRFIPAYGSIEALARAFLDAIALADAQALRDLLVTEREFQNWLWPEFPMSDPAMNVPDGFAWRNLAVKSDKGLRRILREHGGTRYVMQAVRFVEEVEAYPSFRVRGGTRIDARDGRGAPVTITAAGSVVQLNGHYKFMSYRE